MLLVPFNVRLGLFLSWLTLILWLSLSSDPPEVKLDFLAWDKARHALAYALLTVLGGWTARGRLVPALIAWGGAALVAVLVGGVIEIAQGMMAVGRLAEWGDLAANALGALLGGWSGWWASRGPGAGPPSGRGEGRP